MYYVKPKDVRFVDMEIYIDTHIPLGDYDETTVFNYLYALSRMLALKKRICNINTVDEFSVYCACKYYKRLTNPTFTDVPIRTIYNYMNKTIYWHWWNFGNECWFVNKKDNEFPLTTDFVSHSIDVALDSYSRVRFDLAMNDIPSTVRAVVERTPYKIGTTIWNALYVSCLLSLLSYLTIDTRTKELFFDNRQRDIFDALTEYYRTHQTGFVVLYHLPDTMYGYVQVLTLQIIEIIAQYLSEVVYDMVTVDGNVLKLFRQELRDNEQDDN